MDNTTIDNMRRKEVPPDSQTSYDVSIEVNADTDQKIQSILSRTALLRNRLDHLQAKLEAIGRDLHQEKGSFLPIIDPKEE